MFKLSLLAESQANILLYSVIISLLKLWTQTGIINDIESIGGKANFSPLKYNCVAISRDLLPGCHPHKQQVRTNLFFHALCQNERIC